MPRRARAILGVYACHVLNRANGRLKLFRKQADFESFEQILVGTNNDSRPLKFTLAREMLRRLREKDPNFRK